MALTPKERAYLAKRERLVRAWPWMGYGLLVLVAAFFGWLWWSTPLLVNPWAMISALEAETIPHSTLVIMAGLLPIIMPLCLLILVVIVLLAFAAFSNERQCIAIIRRLGGEESDSAGG